MSQIIFISKSGGGGRSFCNRLRHNYLAITLVLTIFLLVIGSMKIKITASVLSSKSDEPKAIESTAEGVKRTENGINGNKRVTSKTKKKYTSGYGRKNCHFLPGDKSATPVLLFSLGRSGSDVTWDIMAKLTGRKSAWSGEYVGSNEYQIGEFLKNMKRDEKKDHDWVLEEMCRLQHTCGTQGGIAGFKWKPHYHNLQHEYARDGLRIAGKQQDPPIRVVYLVRNPLDVIISGLKHDRIKAAVGKKHHPHCRENDKKCLKIHAKYGENIVFPTGDALLEELDGHFDKGRHQLLSMLKEFGLDYIEVSYEKLFKSNTADEWIRIFRFLGKGPTKNLAIEDVLGATAIASTTANGRNETIANFEEVRVTLVGTKYEHLLNE